MYFLFFSITKTVVFWISQGHLNFPKLFSQNSNIFPNLKTSNNDIKYSRSSSPKKSVHQ